MYYPVHNSCVDMTPDFQLNIVFIPNSIYIKKCQIVKKYMEFYLF